MKIGVVSDTHSLPLPEQMLKDFRQMDLIVHAGDFCSVREVEQLKKIKELKAVHGNMDESSVRKLFPRSQILEWEGTRVGLFHGEGSRSAILDTVRSEFKGQRLNAVIFGHSHQPLVEEIEGTLFLNPGSPNDTVTAPYCSYGVLECLGDKVKAKIIKIK